VPAGRDFRENEIEPGKEAPLGKPANPAFS
jgi:hypothetical protein